MRVRFVSAIRQRMDAEPESRAELAAGSRFESDVAESRHQQHDAAGFGDDLAGARPALADRDRADLAGAAVQVEAAERGSVDLAGVARCLDRAGTALG